VTIIAWSDV